MTHYLDATAGAVFALLLEGPSTVDGLTTELASMADSPANDILGTAVRQVLSRLDEIGLAEPLA